MKNKLHKLISAAALSLLLPVSHSHAAEIPLDRIAAVVNEGIILQSELEQRTSITREQLQSRNTRIPPEHILRKQVLNRLIIESIQKQMAEQNGVRVSDSQLNGAIANIAAQNGLSIDQFREALIAEGRDYNQAREQIRNEMLINSVQQNLVNRRIRVSEQELSNFLNSEDGKSQASAEFLLGHILIATPSQASPEIIQQAESKAKEIFDKLNNGADFAETAVEFSNAPNALKGGDLGWRKANELPEALSKAVRKLSPGEFSKPVRSPSGFHILLAKDKRGGAVQLIDQRLVSHILLKPTEIRTNEQAKRQISQLYQRIASGEDFAALAKEFSDDPASGSEGGSLGWTQNGQMVPEFEQVMNSTAVGQVSEPFESRFGWHILTVLDTRTEDMGETMQENRARATIRKRKFNEELSNWLREIRSQAYVDIKE
ncbi:peptidylprolyl isomerase [Neptuniibacter caesariensis]|uniref:Chaperone SurA n=1 Tax=Neptuniibacter caesariensis TaxID=207954 RepID=A0A7U8C6A1_NEPCE|nr:peptidylprolyl isomerase [Neptuniibacter caesariensis]EAR60875.1 peptidyl-prolyl cis-trans isomerase SurA [Oceanospirillum sp. MED92] [Neptuniibacter caesariensis]